MDPSPPTEPRVLTAWTYLGLTIVVPVASLAAVVLSSTVSLVLGASLGFEGGSGLSIGLFLVLSGVGLPLAWARLRTRLSVPAQGPRERFASAAGCDDVLGPKAATLVHFGDGAPVAPAWLLGATFFRRHLGGADAAPEQARDWLLAHPPSHRRLRRLLRWARAQEQTRFLVRSAFPGEDGNERAAPGVYSSRQWDLATGAEGLAGAIARVWASRWGERAALYGALPTLAEAELSVIVTPLLPARRAGVAASVEPSSGDPGLQLVEEHGGRRILHDLRTGHMEGLSAGLSAGGEEEEAMRAVVALALRAETQLGRPAEIEWALGPDGEVTVHQLRPLVGLPPLRAVISDGPVMLPAQALTPLSRGFLLGDPGRIGPVQRALEQLTGDPVPAGAFVQVDGRAYMDAAWVKRLAHLDVSGARRVLGPLRLWRLGRPGRVGTDGSLADLRAGMTRLLTAQLATTALQSLARRPDAGDWQVDDRPFELRTARDPGPPPAPDAPRRACLAWQLHRHVVQVADRVRAIGAALPTDHPLRTDDLWFLHWDELERLDGGQLDPSAVVASVHARRAAFSEARPLPDRLLLGPDGQPVDLRPSFGGGLIGVPVCRGHHTGPLWPWQPGLSPPDGAVVLLPDASMDGFAAVVAAAAVVFERGGALSHLSLLCRERGIPAVAGVHGAGTLPPGTRVTLDGGRGTLRRSD